MKDGTEDKNKVFFEGSDYEARLPAIYIDLEANKIYIDKERVNPLGVIAHFDGGWHIEGAKING